ncbi:uncharacterized protein LOC143181437 [Calliopsis andreniformis]|uniref:uncharacterized protein LOC143181437 n=1 Tax=Calliopsis andreniformis TaxID=337506 RepID=UPI003FCE5F6D
MSLLDCSSVHLRLFAHLKTDGKLGVLSLRLHRKPYPCHSCGRSYTRKDTLRRHMRDECGKIPQYICYVCQKGFKQKSNFQRHSANVHGFRMN